MSESSIDKSINLGAMGEALNNKMDRDGLNAEIKPAAGYGVDYVVEWKVPTESDPTWYRKYASGWVEQGGRFTGTASATAKVITLPITMSDTNYSGYGIVQCSSATDTGTSQSYRSCFLKTSTTQITVSQTNTWTTQWEVKGMAA